MGSGFRNSPLELTDPERIELGYHLLEEGGDCSEPEKRSNSGRRKLGYGMHVIRYNDFRRNADLPSLTSHVKIRGRFSIDTESGIIKIGGYNEVIDPASILASTLPETKAPRGGLVRHNYKR